MQAFLVSTGIVALGEMGDKAQLLALVLAARFRRPWADRLGHPRGHAGQPRAGRPARPVDCRGARARRAALVIGISFLAMALWMPVPDQLDEAEAGMPRFGGFGTTLGMMIANVPAVLFGEAVARKVPMRRVHGIAAAIFAVLGAVTLMNIGHLF